jgi:hypothetical protein
MKSTLKSFNESESRLPSLAKSSANGLDLTLSATKTASPLVLIAVLNSRMRAKFGLRDIGFMTLNPEK